MHALIVQECALIINYSSESYLVINGLMYLMCHGPPGPIDKSKEPTKIMGYN